MVNIRLFARFHTLTCSVVQDFFPSTVWWSQTWWFYRPRGQSNVTCKWKFEPQSDFCFAVAEKGSWSNQFGHMKILCWDLMIFADVWWLLLLIVHDMVHFHDLGLSDTRSWCISTVCKEVFAAPVFGNFKLNFIALLSCFRQFGGNPYEVFEFHLGKMLAKYVTPAKTNQNAPEKTFPFVKGKDRLPSTIFQGRKAVGFRECKLWTSSVGFSGAPQGHGTHNSGKFPILFPCSNP